MVVSTSIISDQIIQSRIFNIVFFSTFIAGSLVAVELLAWFASDELGCCKRSEQSCSKGFKARANKDKQILRTLDAQLCFLQLN